MIEVYLCATQRLNLIIGNDCSHDAASLVVAQRNIRTGQPVRVVEPRNSA